MINRIVGEHLRFVLSMQQIRHIKVSVVNVKLVLIGKWWTAHFSSHI